MHKIICYLLNHRILSALLAFILLVSCSTDHQEIAKFELNEWRHDNILKCDLESVAKDTSANLLISIGHDPEYGYQNVYIQLTGLSVERDTLYHSVQSFELMDKFGIWLGKKKSDYIVHNVELNIPFDSDYHELQIGQYSRDSILHGIRFIALLRQMKITNRD